MAESNTLSHVEKLNIATRNIEGIKQIIKKDIANTLKAFEKNIPVQKNTFHIIGPAGVGKTQINYQIKEELSEELGVNFDLIMIKAPVLSRDDILIPFPKKDGTSFDMLYSDFIPMEEDSYGLLIIDEASRGDHALQQLMWQIQNEHKVHLRDLPKGWFVIATDNPDDAEYNMDVLEDAAGLRRMIHVYTEVSAKTFLEYGKTNNIHPLVMDYVTAKPDMIYDFTAQKKGSVYANPASWEKLSDHLHKFDLDGGYEQNKDDFEVIAGGLINTHVTRLFTEFLESAKEISPKDIFFRYDKKEIREVALDYVKDNNNAKLGEMLTGFFTYLSTSTPRHTEKHRKNIIDFLTDIPIDTAALFITNVDTLNRKSKEYAYITKLHMELSKDDKYMKQFYEKLAGVMEG